MAKLSGGFLALAFKMQEVATVMCHDDIRIRLEDAIRDAYENTGQWCYIVAVFGDDQSGDVVYSCSSDLKKAAYTISGANCVIDTMTAVNVQPLTTYEVEGLGVMEAGARNSKRDLTQLQTIHDSAAALGANCSMAESAASRRALLSQSAKGPAVEALRKLFGTGDIGSICEALKSNSQEAARAILTVLNGGASSRESETLHDSTSLSLVESASTLEQIVLREARADYEIKLIAPGKGSSAFYPAEVLKRDGPKVFSAGTHVYLNHPTRAEEAARPEGDVKNLAGVLTTAAAYHESHAKGPGLYARMKVFADHGQLVEEKAAHVGMSIRAEGVAESGQTREGRPVLKQLVSAESVDVVTHAGAGGMILQESATGPNNQGDVEMTKEEIQALVEAGVTAKLAAAGNATVTKLMERAQRGDATVIASRILASITLPEPSKQRVIEAVLMGSLPLTEAGEVDEAKLTPLVEAAAKKEGAYVAQLTGGGRVVGMGGGPSVQPLSEADRTAEEARAKANQADAENVFKRFGLNEAQAKAAAGKAA